MTRGLRPHWPDSGNGCGWAIGVFIVILVLLML